MSNRFITYSRLIGLATLLTATACGGNGSTADLPVGFYRGTISLDGPDLPVVTNQPAVLNRNADGSFQAFWLGTASGDLSFAGGTGAIVVNGTVVDGTAQVSPGALGFSFRMVSGGQPAASGAFQAAALPTLGSKASVPSSGTYTGELLVVSRGQAAGLGTATCIVQADGSFIIFTGGGGAWVNAGQFSGTFEPNGSIPEATLISNGSVIVQANPSPYSSNGQTLVVRFDSLLLDPGSAWMTMTYASSSTTPPPTRR